MDRLIVVRHGQTDFNVQKRYTGSKNIKLNEKGIALAKFTASKLKAYDIDIIISSTLNRARQTAEIISTELNIPIIEMKEFCEKNVGVYEGLTREEVKNKYPHLWKKFSTPIYDEAPDGAETIKEVEKRVFYALEHIINNYTNEKNVLVVTHGFIARVINKFFNKVSEDEFFKYRLENCDIAEYVL